MEPKRYITWQEYTKLRLKLELLDIEIEELQSELRDMEPDDPEAEYVGAELAELTEKYSRMMEELTDVEVTGRLGDSTASNVAVAVAVAFVVVLILFLLALVLSL